MRHLSRIQGAANDDQINSLTSPQQHVCRGRSPGNLTLHKPLVPLICYYPQVFATMLKKEAYHLRLGLSKTPSGLDSAKRSGARIPNYHYHCSSPYYFSLRWSSFVFQVRLLFVEPGENFALPS